VKALVNAVLQQADKAKRRIRTLLRDDDTGWAYFNELVALFIGDAQKDAAYFTYAEEEWQKVSGPVEQARETLRDVVGIEHENFHLLDGICNTIQTLQDHCGSLWEIAATQGRDAVVTKYKQGQLFFQRFVTCP
jgi:hypothetical protein